jgi:Flp pilus assembly protein TadD
LFKLGKVAESLTWFEQAQRRRDDPEVAAHLGEALWTLGRQREARAVWEAARRKHPNDPKLLATVKRLAP